MKKFGSTIQILSLGCACLIGVGSPTQSGAATAQPNSGHLLVYRAAKFGDRLNLALSVDGKNVASLTKGQTYDGYLPAGHHVLVAQATPSGSGVRQGQQTVTIQAGHTYAYTAVLSGNTLELVKKK